MKSIKTGFVVVVMLGVVWGVWKMLNKQSVLPEGLRDGSITLEMPQANFGPQPTPGTPPAALDIQGPGHGHAHSPATPGALPENRQATHLGATNNGYQPSPARDVIVPPGMHGHSPVPPTDDVAIAPPTSEPSNPYATSPAMPPTDRFADTGPPVMNAADVDRSAYVTPDDSTAQASDSDSRAFKLALEGAQDQLARGEFAEALFTLSLWYGSEEVPAEMESQLIESLDQLAGKVIYSREHLLEPAYQVQSGETLEDIAVKYDVPWQLLANINGITDPMAVQAGQPLKVVRGPFNAQVSLEKQELTLFVGRRYAGRFPVAFGNDPQPMKGEYAVREKETQRTFIDREGRTFAPGAPGNPYGPYWIGLGGRLGIHGKPDVATNPANESTGAIMVEQTDAVDLFAILSQSSKVEIRR